MPASSRTICPNPRGVRGVESHGRHIYGALRKERLDAVRLWPGCETVAGIQIIRNNGPTRFSVKVTLYGKSEGKTADRAISYVEREKRQQDHLTE